MPPARSGGPSSSESPRPAGRQLRADARRNRDRIRDSAAEVFAEQGIDAPMDDIARRAGVGVGTIYRHFPTKEALFEAIVSHRVDELGDEAEALADTEDPGAAFFDYLTRMTERGLTNRALIATMTETPGFDLAVLRTRSDRMMAALSHLLARAQEASAVRADVDAADVKALMLGCHAVERQRPSGGRLAAVIFDGLRPRAGGR
jgi:AcrR family transcriptional regulator